MPKGLRHGFGVNAFQSNVPPHLVQRWLGHASLKTTAIYGDVIGPEERAFAARMWKTRAERPRARRRGSGETNDRRERRRQFHAESKTREAKNGEGNMSGAFSDAVDRHVGSRIRMRRLMLGLGQAKLADQLELTFQQVQKYEKGSNRIGAGRLHQLSHILDVPVSFFFEGAPKPTGLPSRPPRRSIAAPPHRLCCYRPWAGAGQSLHAN